MKAKLNLSGVKRILLEHGEKIIFAGVALVFLGLTYGAISREVLPSTNQPERLRDKAQEVTQHVTNSQFDTKGAGISLIDFTSTVQREHVSEESFPAGPLNPSIVDDKKKRGVPKYFKVEQPRAVGGYGVFALKGAGGPNRGGAADQFNPGQFGGGGGFPEGGFRGRGDMTEQQMRDMMEQRGGGRGGRGGGGGGGGGNNDRNNRGGGNNDRNDRNNRGGGNDRGGNRGGNNRGGNNDKERQRERQEQMERQRQAEMAQQAAMRSKGHKPSASAVLKGHPYVAITALIPRSQQEQEYVSVFRPAADYTPSRDVPQYSGFEIQRAEVTSDPTKLDWKKLDKDDFPSKWETASIADPLQKELAEAGLTMPLGPLVGADWTEATDHPGLRGGGMGGRGGAQPVAAGGERGGDANRGGDRGGDPNRRGGAGRYKLFRAFDFTVDPNKKYQYRVRLALKNPNAKIRPQYLEEPELASKATVYTEWSEPTAVAGVPGSQKIIAGPIVKAGTRAAEPLVKVMVTAIDDDKGIEAGAEVEVMRGALANKHNVGAVKAHDPRSNQIIELDKVDFVSSALVVDIRGGTASSLVKKDKSLVSPSEMLIMDSAGNLTVRNEFEDRTPFEIHTVHDNKASQGKKK